MNSFKASTRQTNAPTSGTQESDESRVDAALLKIKAGSSNYKTLSDYCKALIKKFDTNKDGIKVFKGEQAAMMRRIDEERAGVISYDGLFKALSRV